MWGLWPIDRIKPKAVSPNKKKKPCYTCGCPRYFTILDPQMLNSPFPFLETQGGEGPNSPLGFLLCWLGLLPVSIFNKKNKTKKKKTPVFFSSFRLVSARGQSPPTRSSPAFFFVPGPFFFGPPRWAGSLKKPRFFLRWVCEMPTVFPPFGPLGFFFRRRQGRWTPRPLGSFPTTFPLFCRGKPHKCLSGEIWKKPTLFRLPQKLKRCQLFFPRNHWGIFFFFFVSFTENHKRTQAPPWGISFFSGAPLKFPGPSSPPNRLPSLLSFNPQTFRSGKNPYGPFF